MEARLPLQNENRTKKIIINAIRIEFNYGYQGRLWRFNENCCHLISYNDYLRPQDLKIQIFMIILWITLDIRKLKPSYNINRCLMAICLFLCVAFLLFCYLFSFEMINICPLLLAFQNSVIHYTIRVHLILTFRDVLLLARLNSISRLKENVFFPPEFPNRDVVAIINWLFWTEITNVQICQKLWWKLLKLYGHDVVEKRTEEG